jgi:hypothetical protein
MAKKEEKPVEAPEARNAVTLGATEFELTMPKGRKGRKGILVAQKAFEALMDAIGGSSGIDRLDGADALKAGRVLLEYDGFEDDIMPWVLQNTTAGWTKAKSLEFLDDLAVSPIEIMNMFIAAMFFFLAGSDQPALEEAMGK